MALPTEYAKEEKVHIVGYVSKEPDIRQDKVNYVVTITEGDSGFVGKKILLSYELYPRFSYGMVLSLSCSMQIPKPINDFRYDMYLANMDVFIICSKPYASATGEIGGNIFLRNIFMAKSYLAHVINNLWHEPYAGFMAGLLYGYRGGLGTLNELFSITGVTHIIAISGYNITLIVTILLTLFIHLSIPRKKAFFMVVLGVVVFVIFAGASASVVRAGIMGIIVLVAKQLGRRSSMLPTILLCACMMVLINPFVLVWDAGFQLSFLSTLGLVYISPVITYWLNKVPELFGLKENIISTISATLITLPLILFQFERFSVVAIVVNVLVLWILPYIMIMGFFSVVLYPFIYQLSALMSWIAWGMMYYIVSIVTWFAHIPYAAIDVSISASMLLILYIMLFFIIRHTYKRI